MLFIWLWLRDETKVNEVSIITPFEASEEKDLTTLTSKVVIRSLGLFSTLILEQSLYILVGEGYVIPFAAFCIKENCIEGCETSDNNAKGFDLQNKGVKGCNLSGKPKTTGEL
jgi:hypothetical protein